MKPSSVFAVFLSACLLGMIFLGAESDLKNMPPESFGRSCGRAEGDVRRETPPKKPPPPARNGVAGDQTSLSLFPWDQLSPRAGFGLASSRDDETWGRLLGAGWYVDWRALQRYPTQRPEHWQMILLGRGCMYPNQEALRWLARRYPGNVWIVGNEPDNVWQDNLWPEEYAQVYHDAYYLLKEADPSAGVAVAGITQGTPARLAYLDRVVAAYESLYDEPMPVDWWTLHGFVLREETGSWGAGIPPGIIDPSIGIRYEIEDVGSLEYFQQHVINFRTWMAENGYRTTPLAITEYGILIDQEFGYPPEVVAQYLTDTFSWLETAADPEIGYPQDANRLVQRWAWFCLYDPLYPGPSLANLEANALTDIGMAFRNYVASQSP